MKEVIRVSDIVLEVLDARFVDEMRNVDVEKEIKSKGKKLIYVLNKADLVDEKKIKLPKEVRSSFVFVSSKTKKGAKSLRDRIKIEAKKVELGDRKRVQVGIVGYPNAGKSSLINLISRRGATKTSAKAGYTKGMQKIRFSDNILILDTPGVIPGGEYSTESKTFAKDVRVGARTYSEVKDPEDIVEKLMSTDSRTIENFYGFDVKGNAEILIEELGKKKKFLGRGGKVDVDRTARLILREWQEGKIKG